MVRWNDSHNQLLFSLFKENVLPTKNISPNDILLAKERYFPDRSNTHSFSTLYRRKARQFNIEQAKRGGRQSGKSNYIFYFCFIAIF